MEPVTHILTGACLARTGLNRRAAYTTVAMAIAAELPDIDTVWSLHGPVSGFEHHRGITHTFLGVPFEAAILVLGFAVFHKVQSRRAYRQQSQAAMDRPAVVRWGYLYVFVLLALLSHLLLDYTNNYGIRPFFPFHDAWYAGSIVFIFDPLIFLLLLAGLLMPVLFGFIGREVGAKRERFRGRGWARAVLALIVLLWGARWMQHRRAVLLAEGQTLRAPLTATGEISTSNIASSLGEVAAPQVARPLLQATRVWASPDPLSIFRWYTATDFGPAYSLGVADTYVETLVPDMVLVKPPASPALLAAKGTQLGHVYLDWSAMPMVRMTDGVPPSAPESALVGAHTVTLTDMRFMGDLPFLGRSDRPPLSGQVILNASGRILAEGIDGRFGH